MKIMIVNTFYYPEICGGAEYSVKKLAENLQSMGHNVVVLCTGNFCDTEYINNVRVVRIKTHNMCRANDVNSHSKMHKIIRKILDFYNPLNKRELTEIIVNEKPDVIHTNGLYDISPIIWHVAKKNGIRVIHTIRDYSLCCPIVSMDCSSSKKCRIPNGYCSIHRMIHKYNSRFVDCVTAPSQKTLNTLISLGFFKNSEAIVIPNAEKIDWDFFRSEKSHYDNRSKNTLRKLKIVYLGALSEKKGVRWLIESFVSMGDSNAELFIAGKGELEAFVSEYVNDNIHYLGFLSETKMNELLHKMDLLVCPSLWEEPFGRVVLDAYKHSIPVIVTNRGALPALVREGKTGFIVDPNDCDSLKNTIGQILLNPEILETLRTDISDVLKNYTIERQLEDFLKIYSD